MAGEERVQAAFSGFGHQRPRRTLNIVIRKFSGGEEWVPMFGLAAAPDRATAIPRRTVASSSPALEPDAYSRVGR